MDLTKRGRLQQPKTERSHHQNDEANQLKPPNMSTPQTLKRQHQTSFGDTGESLQEPPPRSPYSPKKKNEARRELQTQHREIQNRKDEETLLHPADAAPLSIEAYAVTGVVREKNDLRCRVLAILRRRRAPSTSNPAWRRDPKHPRRGCHVRRQSVPLATKNRADLADLERVKCFRTDQIETVVALSRHRKKSEPARREVRTEEKSSMKLERRNRRV